MLSKILRSAALATIAVGATVAQANPFAGTPTQKGALTWSGSSNNYAPVFVTYSGANNANGRWLSTGQFQGYFDPEEYAGFASNAPINTPAESDDFFRFFCIDLAQLAIAGPLEYTRTEGVPPPKLQQIARLFEYVYPNQETELFYKSGNQTNFGSFTDTKTSAAMQLAIWEIWFDNKVTDDDTWFDEGLLKASGNTLVTKLANDYMKYINDTSNWNAEPTGWTFYQFSNPDRQDYLSATYTPPKVGFEPPGRIPLPGTLALLGAGLAGLGLARRKS